VLDSNAIRKQIHSLRQALSQVDRECLSEEIAIRFAEIFRAEIPKNKRTGIALYRPLKDELSLRTLEAFLVSQKVPLFYPKLLNPKLKEMDFYHVEDPLNHDWVKGTFGIQEPHSQRKAEKGDLFLIIVPGVAFGKEGERLGRGEGYYDRLLPKYPDAIRLAPAFEFQLVEKLPQESWDQKMDWILTECSEIRLSRVQKWFSINK